MANVQISEELFNKLYAYFIDNEIEHHDEIKRDIWEKSERIYKRFEYSQSLKERKEM